MVTSVPKPRVSAAAASLERGCEHALKSCDGTAFCGWSLCYAGWLPPWQSRFFTITHGGALAVWELEPGKQPRGSTPREDPFATLRCTTRVDLRKLSGLMRETPDCADNFVFRLVTSTHTLRIDPGCSLPALQRLAAQICCCSEAYPPAPSRARGRGGSGLRPPP